jgi:hypothetical protein
MAGAEVDQIALGHRAVEATGANLDIEISSPHCRNNVNAVQRLPAADAQRLRAGVGEDQFGELETKGRMRSIGIRPVVKVLFRARAAN